MTDLTTAGSAVSLELRQQDVRPCSHAGERTVADTAARMMSRLWLRWRRRAVIRTLNKVDDHLLRDAGIERDGIEELVDTLIARR